MAHIDEIQHQIMKKINPAFLALSETRVTEDIEDSEVNVPGYSMVRCNAENRNTGGAVLYVRNDIKYEIVLVTKLESNCWCVAVEVKDKVYKGVILVIYHSPSASHGDFIRFLEDIVEELIIKGECMVIGDFNIDLMTDSFYTKKLQSTMLSLGMKLYVNEPTRITKDSRTIIDLIFANNNKIVQVMHEPKITDHAWLKVELNVSKTESKYREFSARNYKEFDVNEFATLVKNKLQENQEYQGECMDVSERAKNLVNSIVDTLDVTAPRKKFRIPKVWEGKKWFTDEIREAADRRDKAYRRALYDDTEQNWVQYKIERNAVVKLIREKKKEYYENMIDSNKENPTSMWKTLKEIIRGGPVGLKEVGNIDFEILDDIKECNIADKFNSYYIQSINNIVKSIKDDRSGSDIIEHWMNINKKIIYIIQSQGIMENFEIVKIEKLEKVVMGLPKKKGTEEGITSDILKAAFSVIKEEFANIINSSLREGICPESWKTSMIIPIPKIDKAKKASEYRPINMLPIFEKVLELVVKEQLEMYLESNGIITEHQSGFRKYYSCETAIQTVIDEWKLIISEGKMVGVIFVDLKRAFETINRERLLEKMYYYGIRGMALEWFKSYLNNRKQQVRFNHTWSKLLTTEYGVPQGSVLGPLLFIVYINDIIEICPEECNIKMFADDTLIYVSGESSADIEVKMNTVFNIIERWMNVNKLKMNASKTKYMIVRGIRKELRGNIILKCLDGTEIERVETMKYLGIIIDDKLRFQDQCNYMLKKIGKKTSFLNRVGNYISVYTRCIIYKTIIAPHFEYCATLLISMGETQITQLQKVQNRAMRVILQCDRYTKVEDMLEALQFMSVRQRLQYNTCIFIFKILNGLLPNQLGDRLEIVGDEGARVTRQAGNIELQFRKTKSAQKSLFYEGIKMYNVLPAEIKNCDRLELFKRRLKAHILPM